MDYFETNDTTFNPNLEKISETDRVHASVPNERFEQLIKNDVALKNELETHNHNNDYAEKNHKHEEYITNEELGTSLTGVAKESSEYSIENKVQEVATTVSNINNSISQNLQGVAKERSEYSIEDKISEILNNVNKGCIKSVQVITGSITSSATHTINSVDVSKTFLIAQGFSNYSNDGTTSGHTRSAMVSARLTSPTQVYVSYTGHSIKSLSYNVQIVEFY